LKGIESVRFGIERKEESFGIMNVILKLRVQINNYIRYLSNLIFNKPNG